MATTLKPCAESSLTESASSCSGRVGIKCTRIAATPASTSEALRRRRGWRMWLGLVRANDVRLVFHGCLLDDYWLVCGAGNILSISGSSATKDDARALI